MIPNGIVTFRNTETGEHRTFRMSTQKMDSKFAPGKRIISLLVGSDNTSDYKGFGFITDSNDRIALWKKNAESKTFLYYKLLIENAFGKPADGHNRFYKYEMLLEKYCLRCNRLLTHPESIESGIGPECSKRLAA